MKKVFKLIRVHLTPVLVAILFLGVLGWAGFALVTVDNGSELITDYYRIRERVITEDVCTYQRNDANFLYYLGEEYSLSKDNVAFIGESFQEQLSEPSRFAKFLKVFGKKDEKLAGKMVTKSIVFDDDEQEFLYKEETFVHSYAIEKAKRSKERKSSVCFILGILCFILCIPGGIAAFFLCASVVEDQ